MTTKTQLTRAIDRHSNVIAAVVSCPVGDVIEAGLIATLGRTGTVLCNMIGQPMRATVPVDLITMADRMTDRSTAIIAERTNRLEDAPPKSIMLQRAESQPGLWY